MKRSKLRKLTICLLTATAATAADPAVTFNKHVLPLLQKHCQQCHRPGEVAPMSFLTYKETRPWAKAIKTSVLAKKMPPWFADPQFGHFANERRITDPEIATLVKWADQGATEGSEKDKPQPVKFATGWTIGQPDIVVEMPRALQIPATGVIDQSNLLVRVNFPRDLWVAAAEVRPGNARVVHHMKAWVRPPASDWMKDAPEGELHKPQRALFSPVRDARAIPEILAKYNPGLAGQAFTLDGAAKFIPAGSDIVFEIHYTTTGKPESDQSRVGIVLAKAPPQKRYVTTTGLNNTTFVIPAHATNHEVRAETVVENEVQLAWVQPHMHLRAKDYVLRASYPSGESEVLLKCRFDFNWQIGYEFAKPVTLPKGTRLESIAHFDNSAKNSYNPNPAIDVTYGPQTDDEMAVSFMGFITNAKDDPLALLPRPRRQISVEPRP